MAPILCLNYLELFKVATSCSTCSNPDSKVFVNDFATHPSGSHAHPGLTSLRAALRNSLAASSLAAPTAQQVEATETGRNHSTKVSGSRPDQVSRSPLSNMIWWMTWPFEDYFPIGTGLPAFFSTSITVGGRELWNPSTFLT